MSSTSLSSNAVGILAGLGTALPWTATAVCFEVASRRLGTLAWSHLGLSGLIGFVIGDVETLSTGC